MTDTMKTPTHVICPDVPDLPSYLTAGKRYAVWDCQSHDGGDYSFCFTANDGDPVGSYLKRSPHLNGADWIPVYADEESMVEAQSVITDNPRHLTAQESSATKNVNVGAFAKTSLKQTVPTWSDVGPGLLEALKNITDCYGVGSTPEQFYANVRDFMDTARAAITSAEKVESHE